MEKAIRALSALQKHPRFRYLWAGNLFVFSGVWMQNLVMGWLVYDITGSAFLLALFTAARLLPRNFSPIGGLLADRTHRVKLTIALETFSLLLTMAVATLVSKGNIHFAQLAVFSAFLGLSESLVQPVRTTLVMDIVGRQDISNAISLNSIGFDVSRIVGPAAGGLLMGQLGAGPTLWLSALAYVLGIATLLPLLHRIPQRQREVGAPLRELWQGFRIVLGSRNMIAVLSISVSANIFVWPIFQAFMPVFAKDILHAGPQGLGFLMTAMGSGALVGALAIAALGDFSWKGRLYILGTGALGLLFTLFALSRWFPLSLTIMAAAGLASSAFGVMQSALLLILAPEEVRGRVMGIQGLAIGIYGIATLAQGIVADAIGVPHTTAIAGALLALNMLALFLWVPGLRRLR